MALRPFARQPKSDDDEETTPEPPGVDQFFSNDLRQRDDASPDPDYQPAEVTVAQGPGVAVPEHGDPGWYPDADDPGLMRYWDGFHLTGQILHVHQRAGDITGDVRTPEAVGADDSLTTGHSRAGDRPPAPEFVSSVQPLPVLSREGGPAGPPSLKLVESSAAGAPATDEEVPAPGSGTGSTGSTDAATDLAGPEREDGEDEAPDPSSVPSAAAPSAAAPSAAAPSAAAPSAADPSSAAPSAPARPGAASVTRSAGAPGRPSTVVAPATGAAAPTSGSAAPTSGPGAPTNGVSASRQAGSVRRPGEAPTVSAPVRSSTPPPAPVDGDAGGEAGKWARKAQEAVTRATAEGTPETWQEAARIAVVVSEMAQTLQASAEAEQVAARTADAAREAADGARLAARKSADAEETATRTQRAAQEAEEAARAARQKAVEAKQAAERASQVVPGLAEAEKAAAEVAAEAQRKARHLGEIVAAASSADTPAAWSEALAKVTEAAGRADTRAGATA
jgi:hypothetical protein